MIREVSIRTCDVITEVSILTCVAITDVSIRTCVAITEVSIRTCDAITQVSICTCVTITQVSIRTCVAITDTPSDIHVIKQTYRGMLLGFYFPGMSTVRLVWSVYIPFYPFSFSTLRTKNG